MLAIWKAKVSLTLTFSINPLLFIAMILILSMKALTIGLFKLVKMMNMLGLALIRQRPSFSSKKLESRSYQSLGKCLRMYKAFWSLHIIS